MDLICPKCAEPWDNDEFHYVEGMSYAKAVRAMRAEGCGAVFGGTCRESSDEGARQRALMSAVAFELMGDDTDGIASMMDDWEAMGY
jgi:hypothetical protein